MAVDPEFRPVNFQHVVEHLAGPLTTTETRRVENALFIRLCNDTLGSIMGSNDIWLLFLVEIKNQIQFTVGQLFIGPPVNPLESPLFVVALGSSDNEYSAIEGQIAITYPELVFATNSGIVVISSEEKVVPPGHVVKRRIAQILPVEVTETYSEIPDLESVLLPLDQLLVAIPLPVDITDEAQFQCVPPTSLISIAPSWSRAKGGKPPRFRRETALPAIDNFGFDSPVPVYGCLSIFAEGIPKSVR